MADEQDEKRAKTVDDPVCSTCNGSGAVDKQRCGKCDGDGRVRREDVQAP